jgi:hypothetical protein
MAHFQPEAPQLISLIHMESLVQLNFVDRSRMSKTRLT